MSITVIYFEQYAEETTDPNEPKESKLLGPFHPEGLRDDSNSVIRIPYTGFVDSEGTEFRLSGFGKLDKKRTPAIVFTNEEEGFLRRVLGAAYTFAFKSRPELQAAVRATLTAKGLPAFQRDMFNMRQNGFKAVAALEAAAGLGDPEPPTPVRISHIGHADND